MNNDNNDNDTPFHDGSLKAGALEEFIRSRIRRHKRRRTGVGGSMTFRFSAYPHADKKLKPKQYEIAVTTDEDGLMADEIEEMAISDTAHKLRELRRRGAIFAGELGGLINNVEQSYEAFCVGDHTNEMLKKGAAKYGMTVQQYLDHVILPMWERLSPPRELPPLPACADEILPLPRN